MTPITDQEAYKRIKAKHGQKNFGKEGVGAPSLSTEDAVALCAEMRKREIARAHAASQSGSKIIR